MVGFLFFFVIFSLVRFFVGCTLYFVFLFLVGLSRMHGKLAVDFSERS